MNALLHIFQGTTQKPPNQNKKEEGNERVTTVLMSDWIFKLN